MSYCVFEDQNQLASPLRRTIRGVLQSREVDLCGVGELYIVVGSSQTDNLCEEAAKIHGTNEYGSLEKKAMYEETFL